MNKQDENKTSQQKKKHKGNFYKRHSVHKEGEYITLHKEIARYKDENGIPLPLTLLGMYYRIRTFPDDWDFNVKGLATVCKISINTATRYLNQLIELGYIEALGRKDSSGKFQTPKYISNETIDSGLWKTKEIPEDFLGNDVKKSNINFSNMVTSDMENKKQYKKDSKYKEETNKSKNNISKEVDSEDIYPSSSKTVSNDICNMDCSCNETQSFSIDKIAKKKKCSKAQELLDKILVLVDKDIQDSELNAMFKDYLISLVEKGQTITTQNYKYMLKKLGECSSNIEEQKDIVSATLENRWTTFYPINRNFSKAVNSVPAPTYDPADDELALDENGNPYEF